MQDTGGQGSANSSQHYYRAYGLGIASPIELTELMPASAAADDVVIRFGRVPRTLDAPRYESVVHRATANTSLLDFERTAGVRFLIRDGREIVIQRGGDYDEGYARLFLQGSCLGVILLQRGFIPLHGNAVVIDGGAVVIAGISGAGKSTLTAALQQRGYPVLSDDISAVRMEPGNQPMLMPGHPRLKLWKHSLTEFGRGTENLSAINPDLEKYYLPLGDSFCPEPRPLRAIYLLKIDPVEQPRLAALSGTQKFVELQSHLYKLAFSSAQTNWNGLFPGLAALANATRVGLLQRPSQGFLLDQLVALIERDLQA